MIRREHFVGTQHRRHREAAPLRLARQLELGLVLEEIREHRIENVMLDRHASEQVIEMIGLQGPAARQATRASRATGADSE